MVLLQLEGQEVPNRVEDKQGDRSGVLEGNRERQGDLQLKDFVSGGDEENPSVLQRPCS